MIVAAAFKLRLYLTTEGTERRKWIGAGWIQAFILSALGDLSGEKTGKQFNLRHPAADPGFLPAE